MEGWHGWDEYAPFYDWENRRTVGRRDVAFWVDLADRIGVPVLELGCGTGRISLPVARKIGQFVGVDRSGEMLRRLSKRFRRAKLGQGVSLIRGDIRALPFRKRHRFKLVMAPYGIVQSLLRDKDVKDTFDCVSKIVSRGGVFAIDLVPDLPRWKEYKRRVSLRGIGPNGGRVKLIETVRQDLVKRLTMFDQEFIEQKEKVRKVYNFSIAFRTLTVPQVTRRLERSGFRVDAVLGDYRGNPWSADADVWVIIARRM